MDKFLEVTTFCSEFGEGWLDTIAKVILNFQIDRLNTLKLNQFSFRFSEQNSSSVPNLESTKGAERIRWHKLKYKARRKKLKICSGWTGFFFLTAYCHGIDRSN